MTSVVNKRKEKYDVYIGRKDIGMHYGNPFSHLNAKGTTKVKSRDEASVFNFGLMGLDFRMSNPNAANGSWTTLKN